VLRSPAATAARRVEALSDLATEFRERLLPLQLDVTDRAADFAAVRHAHQHFGRLDVVVNNAGYGLFGAIEELSEAKACAQIETNLFGALWVTQAALPFLGERTDKRVLSPGPSSHFIVLSLAERGGSGLHSAAQGWLSSRGPP
jgi:NADP-dependent 3-hydroxy acid dehydrogenase YdfG